MIWKLSTLALVALIVALVFRNCGRERGMSEETRILRDSLARTRVSDSARRDSLRRSSAEHVDTARLTRDSARSAATSGSRLRPSRPALGPRSVPFVRPGDRPSPDSILVGRAHYDSLWWSNDSLTLAVARYERASRSDSLALRDANRRADLAESRITSLEDLNQRLARDLAKAADCVIVFNIRCPSRTVTYVAGVVTGIAGTYALTRNAKETATVSAVLLVLPLLGEKSSAQKSFSLSSVSPIQPIQPRVTPPLRDTSVVLPLVLTPY